MLTDHNTARRLRTYSRRSAASLSGDLRKPCFYMHIPKCGGTSVTAALHAVVPLRRRVGGDQIGMLGLDRSERADQRVVVGVGDLGIVVRVIPLVVVGDLEVFFEAEGGVPMVRDDDLFRAKPLRKVNTERDAFLHSVGNSSVFRYEIGAHAYILENYLADPAAATAHYEISQQFQTAQLAAAGHLAYWDKGLCVSFKNHCVPRGWKSFVADPVLPDAARLVLFAGTLGIDDALARKSDKWYRRSGNVDWLEAAWRG